MMRENYVKVTLVVGSAGHFYQLLRVHVVDNLLRYIITITGSEKKDYHGKFVTR
jgi:hypothetical protein